MRRIAISPFVLVLVFPLLCLTACRDLPPPKPYLEVPAELAAYFGVPGEGSFYIFEDTLSGARDTFRVTRQYRLLDPFQETVGVGIYTKYEGRNIEALRTEIRTTRDTSAYLSIRYQPYSVFRIDFPENELRELAELQWKGNVLIGGEGYESVWATVHESPGFLRQLWFAPERGLVRIALETDTFRVWDLVDYQIWEP